MFQTLAFKAVNVPELSATGSLAMQTCPCKPQPAFDLCANAENEGWGQSTTSCEKYSKKSAGKRAGLYMKSDGATKYPTVTFKALPLR